jgi:hypothetical protein
MMEIEYLVDRGDVDCIEDLVSASQSDEVLMDLIDGISSHKPDAIVLDKATIGLDLRWKREYEMQQFGGDRSIISPAFPGLTITAAEILQIE